MRYNGILILETGTHAVQLSCTSKIDPLNDFHWYFDCERGIKSEGKGREREERGEGRGEGKGSEEGKAEWKRRPDLTIFSIFFRYFSSILGRYSGRINIAANLKAEFFNPDLWHSITAEVKIGTACAGNLLILLAMRISIRAAPT